MALAILSIFFLICSVTGCLTRNETGEESSIYDRSHVFSRVPRHPVSTTDRFAGGTIPPRGLGSQPDGTVISSVMNVDEITSAMKGLVNEFGLEIFNMPEATHEGHQMLGVKVPNGFSCDESFRVFLEAGIHARERGGPDGLIYFISDLLWAQREGTGLTYGGKKYTNGDVKTALSTGIVFLPLVNPDGVRYDQATDSCWRKNRNPTNPVDLNRNFDFLWDVNTAFYPGISSSTGTSNVNAQTYHGTAPFSEPETRNVRWLMDKFTKLRWFVDLHSFSGLVLYPWGSDQNQAFDPSQTFTNPAYNGKRGKIPDTPGLDYREYISFPDWDASIIAATHVASGMAGVANPPRHYDAKESNSLYPTSGSADDYAFSRHIVNSAKSLIYGFTIEFGFPEGPCEFYPTTDNFHLNTREIGAGYMEFLLTAARQGLGSARECPSGPDPTCAPTCTPGLPIQCGGRATCEIFNPTNGAPNFGNAYCFCQAGYKASGVSNTDTSKQYHVSWVNSYGDQTHRVMVRPGQDCWDVCNDNRCSEVLTKDACR
ncbi:unnamed protein product [Clonostachys rosea]|uniref:Peptidase M14 domain-containing protein n=1 Tax=Bionectria ochroleuca TaxID=29856 RepID=A0ABY6UCP1_BIOOC|nr:unnamed protein product [Clonostachys rosea]